MFAAFDILKLYLNEKKHVNKDMTNSLSSSANAGGDQFHIDWLKRVSLTKDRSIVNKYCMG